jgi:tripartite-type tricarboxylate transporter receptor subunit TctC
MICISRKRHAARRLLCGALLSAILASIPAAAHAFPDKPISLTVPFTAGGRADIAARFVADALSKNLGVPVNVVNRTGSGGVAGAKHVAESRPDGHTLLITSAAILIGQYTLDASIRLGDFKVIGLVENTPPVIAVSGNAPWKSLRELVAAAKEKPGALSIGSVPGATAQIVAAGFADAAGIQLTHVPFKGDGDAVIALAGGHIDVNTSGPSGVRALAEAKKVRILGVAAKERLQQFPDLPTLREEGVDFVSGLFLALFAPKETPEPVMAALEAALKKSMQDEALIHKMEAAGLGPIFRGRTEAAAFLAEEDKTYLSVIAKLGMLREPK